MTSYYPFKKGQNVLSSPIPLMWTMTWCPFTLQLQGKQKFDTGSKMPLSSPSNWELGWWAFWWDDCRVSLFLTQQNVSRIWREECSSQKQKECHPTLTSSKILGRKSICSIMLNDSYNGGHVILLAPYTLTFCLEQWIENQKQSLSWKVRFSAPIQRTCLSAPHQRASLVYLLGLAWSGCGTEFSPDLGITP